MENKAVKIQKLVIPEGTKLNVNVVTPPELIVPKYSNLVGALHSSDRGEVVLDFFYFDERQRKEDGSVPGFQVAKVALTEHTVKNLILILQDLIKEKS